jgi:calcium-translocating P-type ATPase
VEYYQAEVSAIVDEFKLNLKRGLSSAQVRQNLTKYGPNELEQPPKPSKFLQFLAQFKSPLVYLLLFALVISLVTFLVGHEGEIPYDTIVIALILLLNSIIGYAQEARAQKALDELKSMSAPQALVLRDGQPTKIKVAECVPGDVLLLGEGDIIPADARLFETHNFYVAESAMTGESVPVVKNVAPIEGAVALGDRVNMVFGSTEVTMGTAKAVIVRTGMQTEVGKIALMLQETKEQPSPLTIEMNKLGRRLTILVAVIAVLVIMTILLMQGIPSFDAVIQTLLLGVSLAVAAVPEGLLAILTIVMAIGVQAMAKRNAIVKKLHSVETLGSVNVICSDKTGTLTMNQMKVESLVDVFGQPAEGTVQNIALRIGALANEAVYNWETREAIGDPTETSLINAAVAHGGYQGFVQSSKILTRIPFSSVRKRASVIVEDKTSSGELLLATKGAPDVLLEHCKFYLDGNQARPLTPDRRAQILRGVDDLSDQAFRNLGVAFRPLSQELWQSIDPDHYPDLENLEQDLVYVATFGIIDPARPEAKAAIAQARNGGIRTVMITGDHPLTAAKIAQDLGIIEPELSIREDLSRFALTGQQIETMTDAELTEALQTVNVYARVAPEHKFRIVSLLQAQGNIVAMTGDGVNDAPAVKKADIGISMGITGTEVTKGTAKMILADDNFATIVEAVKQGRIIFNNLRKTIRFLLATNSGEVFIIFFGVLLASLIGLQDPTTSVAVSALTATQILWINLLTDSAPALALGMDKTEDDVMAQKPRPANSPIISAAIWLDIIVFGFVMAVFGLLAVDMSLPGGLIPTEFADFINGNAPLAHDLDAARSMCFTMLVFAEMIYALGSRSNTRSVFADFGSNRMLLGAIALSVLLQVLVIQVPFLNSAFSTTGLSIWQWLICVLFSFFILAFSETKKWLIRRRTA